jgi:hypothetical protein
METNEARKAPLRETTATPNQPASGLRRRASSIDLDTRPYDRAQFNELVAQLEPNSPFFPAPVPDFSETTSNDEVTVVAPPPLPDPDEDRPDVLAALPPVAPASDEAPVHQPTWSKDPEPKTIVILGVVAALGMLSWIAMGIGMAFTY